MSPQWKCRAMGGTTKLESWPFESPWSNGRILRYCNCSYWREHFRPFSRWWMYIQLLQELPGHSDLWVVISAAFSPFVQMKEAWWHTHTHTLVENMYNPTCLDTVVLWAKAVIIYLLTSSQGQCWLNKSQPGLLRSRAVTYYTFGTQQLSFDSICETTMWAKKNSLTWLPGQQATRDLFSRCRGLPNSHRHFRARWPRPVPVWAPLVVVQNQAAKSPKRFEEEEERRDGKFTSSRIYLRCHYHQTGQDAHGFTSSKLMMWWHNEHED